MRRNILCPILIAALLFAMLPAAVAEEKKNTGIRQEKSLPLCGTGYEDDVTISVYYINGVTDIPYINMQDVVDLLRITMETEDDTSLFEVEADEGVLRLTRDTGYTCLIDYTKSQILFDDYNAFFMTSDKRSILDIMAWNGIFGKITQNFERYGREIEFDFKDYDISFYYSRDDGYMPLQCFSDVFMAILGLPLLYTGDAVLYDVGVLTDESGNYTVDGEEYLAKTGTRSAELVAFNYNELCFYLDNFYGLKEEHDITSFDALFTETGLKDMFLRDEPVYATAALDELCAGYFADFHSGIVVPSFYTGADNEDATSDNYDTVAYERSDMLSELYETARRDAGIEDYFYLECGNTAYVTFDEFTTDDIDYYTQYDPDDYLDTIVMIIYAHSRITREDSPIENVVLDLSNNAGGAVDAAVCAISWFLGECDLSIEDTLTGAKATTGYRTDINLDGKFDESDTVSGLNLYCLIGPNSFSCGNLVPAALKASGLVTILGRTSGGGACAVATATTADGNVYTHSSNLKLSVCKNGIFYSVDEGVEPDFIISKPAHYYENERETLTEYINNLF